MANLHLCHPIAGASALREPTNEAGGEVGKLASVSSVTRQSQTRISKFIAGSLVLGLGVIFLRTKTKIQGQRPKSKDLSPKAQDQSFSNKNDKTISFSR